MTQTITYEDAALPIGRGTKGGTLKDLKASLNRYLKRQGLSRSPWHKRRRKARA
ncbi:MAG TPA: hypothetical protein VN829_16210 [Dongiaceae bacterium]|nr:hypothetical protein [Dongiaceae bacterium]